MVAVTRCKLSRPGAAPRLARAMGGVAVAPPLRRSGAKEPLGSGIFLDGSLTGPYKRGESRLLPARPTVHCLLTA
jgi:hypothetical protein